MRKLISVTMMGVVAMGFWHRDLRLLGRELHGEESHGQSTPDGKTTVTDKTTVKTSGDNPPAPKAP